MSNSRKRLGLLVPLLPAFFAVACASGGSDSNPGAKFSNASLAGQYAFSMSGNELCSGQASFFTRAGAFAADGKGNITGGLEDINVCIGIGTLRFTSGKYSIDARGRGTLSLTNSTGTTNYRITLVSTTQGVIAQTDTDTTASGSFQRQNSAAFSNAAIAGGYVFDFNGLEATGMVVNAASLVGRFDADGAGGVARGVFDANIDGSLSGQQLFPSGAFYRLDTNGDGSAWGRGTAAIAGRAFAFYVVDATRVKFIGTDFPSALIGDAVAQQNVAFTTASLGGSFAFSIGGAHGNGSIATVGRFTADGGGRITNVVIDENDSGSRTALPSGTVTGSYTVDGNQLGGGTLTWTDTNKGTFSFIFYLISQTQAVFQEIDSLIVSDGAFSAQTASHISAAVLAGDYAFGWSGISSRGPENFVGQLSLTPSGNVSGKTDFNAFGTHTLSFNVPIAGNLTLSGDGTQASTLTVTLQTSPPATFQFTVYVVDQSTVLPLGDFNPNNNLRVIGGALIRQP